MFFREGEADENRQVTYNRLGICNTNIIYSELQRAQDIGRARYRAQDIGRARYRAQDIGRKI